MLLCISKDNVINRRLVNILLNLSVKLFLWEYAMNKFKGNSDLFFSVVWIISN